MVDVADKVTIDRKILDIWQDKNLEYLRYQYDLKSSDLVMDFGSYTGEFASKIKSKFGCTVIEYDPLVNAAVWIESGSIKTGGAFYYTSMFEEGENSYPCIDVVDAFKMIEQVALLKVNIEGAEYQVLKRMIEHGILSRIKYLQVQFHLIEGVDVKKLYNDIASDLRKTHELQWQYQFVWESWQRKE